MDPFNGDVLWILLEHALNPMTPARLALGMPAIVIPTGPILVTSAAVPTMTVAGHA